MTDRSVTGGGAPATGSPSGDDVAAFADDLRALRARAGAPSYMTLARGTGVPRSTLHDALHGDRLPAYDVLTALVEELGGDVDAWQERWSTLRLALDAGGPATRADDAAETDRTPTTETVAAPDADPEPSTGADPTGRRPARRWRRRWVAVVVAAVVVAGGLTTFFVVRASQCETGERYVLTSAGDLDDAHGDAVERLAAGQTVTVVDKTHTVFEHRYRATSDTTGRDGYVDESKIDFRGSVCR